MDGWRAKAIATQQDLHLDTVYASVHKAKAIEPLLNVLERQGLKLYFLPPYSPELNRIEKLWHKMKYEWMSFKSRDAQTLEADVEEVLAGFGENYKLDFC